MKKPHYTRVALLTLGYLIAFSFSHAQVQSTWTAGSGVWEDANNWNTVTYPGQSAAGDLTFIRNSGSTVTLGSELAQTTGGVWLDQSTIIFANGASATTTGTVIINSLNASGDALIRIDSGGNWTNNSGLQFSRHGDKTDKTGVSELHVNGGTYSQGHNFSLRESGDGTTARIRVTGGSATIVGRDWNGDTNNQELLFSGGVSQFAGVNFNTGVTSSGLFQVSSDATVSVTSFEMNLAVHDLEILGSQATFSSTSTATLNGGLVSFKDTDNTGFSTFNVTTDLTLAGADLEVDLNGLTSGTYDLFDYAGTITGTFNSVNFLNGSGTIDYGTGSGDAISITVIPEPATFAMLAAGMTGLMSVMLRRRRS